MKPSVVQLTPETFKSLVGERKNGETWLVDFYAPWCGPCNELAPDWNKLAKVLKMKHLFSYAWWNDADNDNEIDFIFISEIIMNMTVLLITRMIVTMMLKVVLVIMIIIKNDIDKKRERNDSVL